MMLFTNYIKIKQVKQSYANQIYDGNVAQGIRNTEVVDNNPMS